VARLTGYSTIIYDTDERCEVMQMCPGPEPNLEGFHRMVLPTTLVHRSSSC